MRPWVDKISVDENERMAAKEQDEALAFMQGWADGGSEEQREAEKKDGPNRGGGIARSSALTRRGRRGRRPRR